MFALSFTARTLFLCFIPSAGFAFLGRWIDRRFDIGWPMATVLGLFFSLYVIYRLMLKEAKRYRAFFT